MVDAFEYVLVGLAALAAGAVNALAGGGTLITFPMLTAVGIPAVAANVTNTVALCPGYLGATLAQAGDLRGQRRRLWMLMPASVAGGVLGGVLLLNTDERLFGERVGTVKAGGRLEARVARHAAKVFRLQSAGGKAGAPKGSSLRDEL